MIKALLSLALAGSVVGFRSRKPFPTHFIDAEIVSDATETVVPVVRDVSNEIDECATCVHRLKPNHSCLTSCPYLMAALGRLQTPALAVQAEPEPVLRPALSADDSAAAFAAWIRSADRCGEYNNRDLASAYRQFCGLDRRRPCADNTLRRALRKRPGVTSAVVAVRQSRKKRERQTIWTIQPEETVSRSYELAETFDTDMREAA